MGIARQDSTELTGDINYRKIAEYGSDSDPRAFNFDGELNIANRGIVEFIEVLKLDVAFLYDLLGASQEHLIKPKKFAQTDIDEVIIGHTNEPEYKKLQSNEFMEALRDRTVKIDVPYVTRLSDEIHIYEKDYNSRRVRGKAIAPHTLEVAAMWAVLTRLEELGLDQDTAVFFTADHGEFTGAHRLQTDWVAGTTTALGSLRLVVDGTTVSSLTGNASSLRVESVRLGLVAGAGTGSGTAAFDAFTSSRTSVG